MKDIKEEIANVRKLLIKEFVKGRLGGSNFSIDEILDSYGKRIIESKNKEFREMISSYPIIIKNESIFAEQTDGDRGWNEAMADISKWQKELLNKLK